MDGSSLSERAAERIRNYILTGQIKPGERLNIDGLARTLQTSKTPVREALNMLSAERLVEYRPRLGYAVQTLTIQEYVAISEIQEAIELHICLKLAKSGTPLDFAYLRSVNDEIRRAIPSRDHMRIFSLNETFHMAMYEHCGNPKLVKELRRIWNELLIHRHTSLSHVCIPDISRLHCAGP